MINSMEQSGFGLILQFTAASFKVNVQKSRREVPFTAAGLIRKNQSTEEVTGILVACPTEHKLTK